MYARIGIEYLAGRFGILSIIVIKSVLNNGLDTPPSFTIIMHETYVFNKKRKNLSKTESGERTEQRTTSSRRNKNQKATWGKNQYQLYFFFGLLLFTGRSFEKPLNGVFIYFFKVPEFHLSPLVYYGTAVYCRLVKNRKFEE